MSSESIPSSFEIGFVPYGKEALAALTRFVRRAKEADPLIPVTVVVTSRYAKLWLRRALASSVSGGIVNVSFSSIDDVARLVCDPWLSKQGLREFSNSVWNSIIYQSLRDNPGRFARVIDHPSTLIRVSATLSDLMSSEEDEIEQISRSGRAGLHLTELLEAARARLTSASYFHSAELSRIASNLLADNDPSCGAATESLGSFCVFLPTSLSPSNLSLLKGLASAATRELDPGLGVLGSLILGTTGRTTSDHESRLWAEVLAPEYKTQESHQKGGGPIHGGHISVARCTDASSEVREAVKGIISAMDSGIPLHRMALLFTNRHPYQRIVHEHLSESGIPFFGSSGRTLVDSIAGQFVSRVLSLRESDFARDQVAAWLASAPIVDPGGSPETLVPAPEWDTLSKLAGVTRGSREWSTRLTRLSSRLDHREDDDGQFDPASKVASEQAQRLRQFIRRLIAALGRSASLSDWHALSDWCLSIMNQYLGVAVLSDFLAGALGSAVVDTTWVAEEMGLADDVREAIFQLRSLDEIEPEPDLGAFIRQVDGLLSEGASSHGRVGTGVMVGGIGTAVGICVDRVWIVGLTEDSIPMSTPIDPVLGAIRDPTVHRTSHLLQERQEREFAASIACGDRVHLSFPMVSPDGSKRKFPSLWLEETSNDGPDWPSETPEVQRILTSAHEYDVTTLSVWTLRHDLEQHWLAKTDPWLARAIRSMRDRRLRGVVTEWDGRIPGSLFEFPGQDSANPASASALQDYASCPRKFFLKRILKVEYVDHDDTHFGIDRVDRGSLIHEILEQAFERERRLPGCLSESNVIVDIAEALFEKYESRGKTGTPLLWRIERRRIVSEVLAFVASDLRNMSDSGARPVALEYAFGFGDAPPVEVDLQGRGHLFLRGRIDRIDAAPGDRAVVIDYKTGKPAIDPRLKTDCTLSGTALQLPVYALAAKQIVGDLAVAGEYRFTSQPSKSLAIDIGEDEIDRFTEVATTIVTSASAGLYPARPGKRARVQSGTGQRSAGSFDNCRICDYDSLCPSDRDRQWGAKRTDPDLTQYVLLAEGSNDG